MKKQYTRCKYLAGLILLGLVTGWAFGQSTTVSGTIVDPSGNVWSQATISAAFRPAPNIPGPYIWTGGVYNPLPATIVADTAGAFSITLPTNIGNISPAGSSWTFVVCPNASLQCAIATVPLAGGTLNLIPQITTQDAWPKDKVIATFVPKVYNTNQVGAIPVNQGGLIYRTTDHVALIFDGTTWNPLGSGGGTGSDFGYCNALTHLTGGGNNGILNCQNLVGANGYTVAGANYTGTEVPVFSILGPSIVSDYRQASDYSLYKDPTKNSSLFKRYSWQTNPALSGNSGKGITLNIYETAGYGNTDDAGGAITAYGYNSHYSYSARAGLDALGTTTQIAAHDEDANSQRYYMLFGGDMQSGGAEGVEKPGTGNADEFKYIMGGGHIDSVTSTNQVHVTGNYGTIIAGTVLEDTNTLLDSGNIIAESNPVSLGYPRTLTTSNTHAQSNAWGFINTTYGFATNFMTGTPYAATVTLAHGTFSTSGGSACVVSALHWEEAPYTATAASSGSQIVTLTLRFANPNGSAFVVDGHCKALRLTAERQTDGSGIISAPYYVLVGNPDTTNYWAIVSRGLNNIAFGPTFFNATTAAVLPLPFVMSATARTANTVTATIPNANNQQSYGLIGTHVFSVTGCADTSYNLTNVALTVALTNNGINLSYNQPGSNPNGTTTGCSIAIQELNGFDVVGMAQVASVLNPAIPAGSNEDPNYNPQIDGTYFLYYHDSSLFTINHTVEQPHAPRLGAGVFNEINQATPGEPGTSRASTIQNMNIYGWGNTGPGHFPFHYQYLQDINGFVGNGGIHPVGGIFFKTNWVGKILFDISAPVSGGSIFNVHCPFGNITSDVPYNLYNLDSTTASGVAYTCSTRTLSLGAGNILFNNTIKITSDGNLHVPLQVAGVSNDTAASTQFVATAVTNSQTILAVTTGALTGSSLASLASESVCVSVPTALQGSPVSWGRVSGSAPIPGVTTSAEATAANNVCVYRTNNTASAISTATETYNLVVIQ